MKDSSSGSDLNMDSSIFTFDGTALTVLTTSNLKMKTYNLKALSNLSGYLINSFITFNVIIHDSCD
jgi:hypothetical protein